MNSIQLRVCKSHASYCRMLYALKNMPLYLLYYGLRRLKLHGQNHTKCTQFGQGKKIVFHRLCFLKTEYESKESIFLTICAIWCLFSDSPKQKKTIKKQINLMISVGNDVLLAEIGQ